MWGRLTLTTPADNKLLCPNVIDLDSSKSCHFIGRLSNPSAQFKHKSQHALSVTFLSATHCSISIDTSDANHIKYILTDHSTNGTFIKYRNHTTVDEAVLVGNSNWVNIGNNDEIVFKFKGSQSIIYKFTACSEPLEVNLPGIVSSAASVHSHQSSANQSLVQQQVQQLQDDLKVTEERLASTIAKYEAVQAESAGHQREVISLQDRITTLESDLVKSKESLDMFESNLSATEAFNRKLKTQVQDLKDSSAALVSKLENNAEEVRHKSDQVGKRDALITELNQALASETNARTTAESEIVSLRSRLEEESLRSSRLTSANALLQSVIGERDAVITTLTSEYESLVGVVRRTVSEETAHRALIQSRLLELQNAANGMTALVVNPSWSDEILSNIRPPSHSSCTTNAAPAKNHLSSQTMLNHSQYNKFTQYDSYWTGSEGVAARHLQQDGTEVATDTQVHQNPLAQSSDVISPSYNSMRHMTQQPHTRLFSQMDSNVDDNDTAPFQFSGTQNPVLSAHTQDVWTNNNGKEMNSESIKKVRYETSSQNENDGNDEKEGECNGDNEDVKSQTGSDTESDHYALNMTQLPLTTELSDNEDNEDNDDNDNDKTTDKFEDVSVVENEMDGTLQRAEIDEAIPVAAVTNEVENENENEDKDEDVGNPLDDHHSTPSALSETVYEQVKAIMEEEQHQEQIQEKEQEQEQEEPSKDEEKEQPSTVPASPKKRSRGAKATSRISLSQPPLGDADSVSSQQSKRGRHARSTVRAVTTPTSAKSKQAATITSDPTHGTKSSRHAAKRPTQSDVRRRLDKFDEIDENSGPEKVNSQSSNHHNPVGLKPSSTQLSTNATGEDDTCNE